MRRDVSPTRGAPRDPMQEFVPSLRLSFCLNAGPKQGAVLAAAVVKAERAALVQVATNKLKLGVYVDGALRV